jgi:hypothetical protein
MSSAISITALKFYMQNAHSSDPDDGYGCEDQEGSGAPESRVP